MAPMPPAPRLRLQLPAVVLHVSWMRWASDITRLCLADVELQPDGRTCYLVPDLNTAPRDGLHTRALPRAHADASGLPRDVLSRLLEVYRAARSAPSSRVLTRCPAKGTSNIITACLRNGLSRIGVVAPVGTFFASHSLKKRGATAAASAGISSGAITELSDTTELTLAESHISALAVPSCYDQNLFGRLLEA